MKNIPSMSSMFQRAKNRAADPVRDWFVLISLSGIVFIAVIVWHIWAFDIVAGGGTLGSGGQNAQVPFDSSSLSAIHSIFENRATEAAKYQTGVYRFADPSQ